jgi:hypothetical protein
MVNNMNTSMHQKWNRYRQVNVFETIFLLVTVIEVICISHQLYKKTCNYNSIQYNLSIKVFVVRIYIHKHPFDLKYVTNFAAVSKGTHWIKNGA